MKRLWLPLSMIALMGTAHAQDRPNVVVMLADNVGYGDIGVYGAGEVRGMPTSPIDGVDQGAFFTGKQEKSNRESLITFIGEEVSAVRWRQYRIYPKEFVSTAGNPAMYGLTGRRAEGNGFPAIFNIEADPEADPREEVNVLGTSTWVLGEYLRVIGEYQKSLEKHPNPKAVNLTQFGK